MEQQNKYLVCVRCFTFNHAKYIEDTMNGFTMQQTTFPFVCVIVDDASTDGEPEVIKNYLVEHFQIPYRNEETEYAYIICAHHKNNPNCDFVVLLLKFNHYSINKDKMPYLSEWVNHAKYHAVCEGDDYWTDVYKLQKQVDFLDSNLDYSLTFHAVYEKFEGKPYFDKIRAKVENREYTGLEWYKDRPSQYASFVFRTSVLNTDFYKKVSSDTIFIAGDIPLLLTCARFGKLRGISDVMSVYRHNETGWTQKRHSKEALKKIIDSQLHYSIFGQEYIPVAEGFYHTSCLSSFFGSLRYPDNGIGWEYLKWSWLQSPTGTVKAFFKVLREYIRKYAKI